MDLEEENIDFLQAQLGSVNEMLSRMDEKSITSRMTMTSYKKRLEKAIEKVKEKEKQAE